LVFEIDRVSSYTIGDGFAFAIRNTGSRTLGEAASRNGHEGISSVWLWSSTRRTTAAWQMRSTQFRGDGPPGLLADHVAVHSRGTEPNWASGQAILGSVGLQNIVLFDRRHHMALARYTPGTLSVFLDDFAVPALTVELDLEDLLNLDDDSASIGFTAGTEPGSFADFLLHG
jgi:hypothetical protein